MKIIIYDDNGVEIASGYITVTTSQGGGIDGQIACRPGVGSPIDTHVHHQDAIDLPWDPLAHLWAVLDPHHNRTRLHDA